MCEKPKDGIPVAFGPIAMKLKKNRNMGHIFYLVGIPEDTEATCHAGMWTSWERRKIGLCSNYAI